MNQQVLKQLSVRLLTLSKRASYGNAARYTQLSFIRLHDGQRYQPLGRSDGLAWARARAGCDFHGFDAEKGTATTHINKPRRRRLYLFIKRIHFIHR